MKAFNTTWLVLVVTFALLPFTVRCERRSGKQVWVERGLFDFIPKTPARPKPSLANFRPHSVTESARPSPSSPTPEPPAPQAATAFSPVPPSIGSTGTPETESEKAETPSATVEDLEIIPSLENASPDGSLADDAQTQLSTPSAEDPSDLVNGDQDSAANGDVISIVADDLGPEETDQLPVSGSSGGWVPVDAPGQGYFPCHPNKGLIDASVSCDRVQIPSLLCKRCALRPTNTRGEFQQCDNIFDTSKDSCKHAMQEYVVANSGCDPVRAAAVPKWIAGDIEATKIVDYFLYSVCELCCDCIPMGVQAGDYRALKDVHSEESPTLWDEERGNCPAHAEYDLCRVLPNVAYLTTVGGPAEERPPACPYLHQWLNSDRSNEWQTNPNTEIDDSTRVFLRSSLSALMCHRSAIWKKCFEMESLQDHLSVPDTHKSGPEAVLQEESNQSEPDMFDGHEKGVSGDNEKLGASCFPGNATVELESGLMVPMNELRVGDRVRTSHSTFSDVFMFSHRDSKSSDPFYVRITAGNASVVMTAGHFLVVIPAGAKGSIRKLVRAENVEAGDTVELNNGYWKDVSVVSRVAGMGLYNPHTVDGHICVGGVRTSTFTAAVHSTAGCALLSPLRALYRLGAFREGTVGAFLARGAMSFALWK